MTGDLDNGTLDVSLVHRTRRSNWFVYVAFLFPALAGFLFGYDIGGASGAVRSLDVKSNATSGIPLHDIENALYTSASLMGATLGSILVFWIGEPLGRRRELMCGSLLYALGALVSGLGPGSAATVVTGRAVYGLGIAFSMHSAPVYISEMAPADKRGLLVSLKEGFIVLGILMGFGATAIAEDVLDEATVYRAIWLPSSAIACVILIGMSLMPESARWLLLRGDPSDVSQSQATTYPSPTIFGTSATGSLGLQRSTLLAEEATGRSPSRTAAAAALRRFRRGASEAEIEAESAEIEMTLSDVRASSRASPEIDLRDRDDTLLQGVPRVCPPAALALRATDLSQ